MNTYKSICTDHSAVAFPVWRGERHYMLPFTTARGLPTAVRRYTSTVDQMMEAIKVDPDQECYLMIDEGEVAAGTTHRRPGLHVDGYWHPVAQCHGAPSHSPRPQHRPGPGRHTSSSREQHEALLLASSYCAARAVVGSYERDFLASWNGGDCADLDVSEMQSVELKANRVYAMDVFSLHESLRASKTVRRTLVRINAPGGILQ